MSKSKNAAAPIDEAALRVQVAARMKSLGLKQIDLASVSGFSQGKLSAWLAGRKKIRVDTLLRLLQAVGLGLIAAEIDTKKEEPRAAQSR